MLADGLTDSDNSTFDELFAAFELPEQQSVNFSKKYKKKTNDYVFCFQNLGFTFPIINSKSVSITTTLIKYCPFVATHC